MWTSSPTRSRATSRSLTGAKARSTSMRCTVRTAPFPEAGPTSAPGSSLRAETTPSSGDSMRNSPSRMARASTLDWAEARVASAEARLVRLCSSSCCETTPPGASRSARSRLARARAVAAWACSSALLAEES